MTISLKGIVMVNDQLQQLIQRLPTLLCAALVGGVVMGGMSRFPVLIEVNLGEEQSHVKFDSRTGDWCEAIGVNTY